jgi:nitrogen fixation/metabolism regulation signal transduction histidine kinase
LSAFVVIIEMKAPTPLRGNEEFIRGVLNSLPQEIAVLDEAGVLIAVNEPWERFARENGGAPDVVSVGANYLNVCRNSAKTGDIHACEALEGIESLLAGARDEFMMEYPCDAPDCERWFVMHGSRSAFGRGSVILSHTDITPQKKAEEALRQNNRRKDEFLATLAHELRNPLAPIQNGVHVLRRLDGDDPASRDRARRALTIVDRQVAHLVRLVDDLLEVSRITTGKIELRKQHLDLAAVIQQALEMSEPSIKAGKHKISLVLDHEPLIVDGDPVRLTQVFANLFNNAAKYTPPKGQIEISAKREGDQALVSVRDNGIGVSADMLPRIFDLFTQSPHSLVNAKGGIGVGLSLARKIVEMHGGQVEGRSNGVGHGSEFVVRLPLADRQLARETTEGETTVAPPPALRRVLIVDDDRDLADILAMLFQALGCDARAVYSGAAGLAAVAEFKPQMAFLDIGMLGMDGCETARKIRKLPGGKNIVLIALSGWSEMDDRRRAMEAGFDHHFVKPIGIDVLKKLLASALVSA